MTAKTPISILNEYMFRHGQVPQYELVHTSAGHDTVFEYQVKVRDVYAKGSGRSKKEAKHNAANNALEELAKSDDIVRDQLLLTSGVPSTRVATISKNDSTAPVAVSPYSEHVTENAVGALTDLCAEHKLAPPVYKLTDESGPPHDKKFKIQCSVHSLVEIGIARTKQQGKHIAAKLMINKIKEHLHTQRATELLAGNGIPKKTHADTKKYDAVIQSYRSVKEKGRVGVTRENVSLTIAACHLNLKGLDGPQVKALKSKDGIDNPELALKLFAEEQNVDLTFSCIDADENGTYLCAACLGTTPELVQFGEGRGEDTAREIASHSLLLALQCMISDGKNEE